jgi:hypothetical protein
MGGVVVWSFVGAARGQGDEGFLGVALVGAVVVVVVVHPWTAVRGGGGCIFLLAWFVVQSSLFFLRIQSPRRGQQIFKRIVAVPLNGGLHALLLGLGLV